MAPEVFTDPSCPRTVKYDVYSFGILLWELLSEKSPYENGIDIDCLLLAQTYDLLDNMQTDLYSLNLSDNQCC